MDEESREALKEAVRLIPRKFATSFPTVSEETMKTARKLRENLARKFTIENARAYAAGLDTVLRELSANPDEQHTYYQQELSAGLRAMNDAIASYDRRMQARPPVIPTTRPSGTARAPRIYDNSHDMARNEELRRIVREIPQLSERVYPNVPKDVLANLQQCRRKISNSTSTRGRVKNASDLHRALQDVAEHVPLNRREILTRELAELERFIESDRQRLTAAIAPTLPPGGERDRQSYVPPLAGPSSNRGGPSNWGPPPGPQPGVDPVRSPWLPPAEASSSQWSMHSWPLPNTPSSSAATQHRFSSPHQPQPWARNDVAPPPQPVKREVSPLGFSGLGLQDGGFSVENIGTARQAYIPVSRGFVYELVDQPDGTTTVEAAEPLTREHRDQTMFTNIPQVYDQRLDHVFPIRDPSNPHLVHPNYASSADPRRASGRVQIENVRLTASTVDQLWSSARSANPGMPNTAAAKNQFAQNITAACRAEFASTLPSASGSQPSPSAVQVIKVEPRHCSSAAEANALTGQYGVVLSDHGSHHQPTLANGRILGFFAGSRIETPEDETRYRDSFGPQGDRFMHEYGADVNRRGTSRRVTYAPYGGGNPMQYANSAFKLVGDSLIVDQRACNASLHPVTVDLINVRGEKVSETMLFCSLNRDLRRDEQVRLDYGPNYRLDLSRPQVREPLPAPSTVKAEPREPSLGSEPNVSPANTGQVSMAPPPNVARDRTRPGESETERPRRKQRR